MASQNIKDRQTLDTQKNDKEFIQPPKQFQNSICGSIACCRPVYSSYICLKWFFVIMVPAFALLNIGTDIWYIVSHYQTLRYVDFLLIYLICFSAPLAFGLVLTLVWMIKQNHCGILLPIKFLICAWLDVFVLIGHLRNSDRLGFYGYSMLYFKCVVNVIQFMIQFYIIGYTNAWNVFLIIKTIVLIWQIFNRFLDCCDHKCCCNVQPSYGQYSIRHNLGCLGDEIVDKLKDFKWQLNSNSN